MFAEADRDRVRERLLSMARSDRHVVAAAELGSLAVDEGDRWSDLDLMFAVADETPVLDVVEAWTSTIDHDLEATKLFDLERDGILYRVFVLPDGLELDLSFVPASAFRPGGPRFRLRFGETGELDEGEPPRPEESLGYAVHHAMHARIAIERGRFWLAEFWIGAVRDYALSLECLERGLDGSYGRDFDRLPSEVTDRFRDALVGSLTREELERALACAVAGLRDAGRTAPALLARVDPRLAEVSTIGSQPSTEG